MIFSLQWNEDSSDTKRAFILSPSGIQKGCKAHHDWRTQVSRTLRTLDEGMPWVQVSAQLSR